SQSRKIYISDKDEKISLYNHLFSPQNINFHKWPYFALAVCFPFLVSLLSIVSNLPDFIVNEPNSARDGMVHWGQILHIVTYFSSSILIVLVTVELGLISTTGEKVPEHWKRILITALIFDIIMFFFVSSLNWSLAREGVDEIWNVPPQTLLAIVICTLASLFASLYVIFCVKILENVAKNRVSNKVE
ncbi:MAG: hypothetical protein AAF423_08985, partial [Pseudomonadota bacterium]